MQLRPKKRTRSAAMLAGFLIGGLAVAAGQSANNRPKTWSAMGTSPCSWSLPIEKKDHTLDVAATIRLLQANHFNCYVQPIEEKPPMSFSDFQRLLPAAQKAGISVWPVLISQTVGSSLPYRYDFVRWMKVLARLSLQYPVLRGVNIDDTDAGKNPSVFTRSYFCQIDRTAREINPRLLFIPTIYDLDADEANRLAGCVDGVWLWWTNLEQNNGLRAFLRDGQAMAGNRFPVYAGVYAHSTSWHKEGPPLPKIIRQATTLGCTWSHGVVLWQLPLTQEPNPALSVAKEFVPGGSSPLAGHCGIGAPSPGSPCPANHDAGKGGVPPIRGDLLDRVAGPMVHKNPVCN
ncbi:MAG TPA: hypothetical protein VGS10_17905 [Terracidiphilus sp.]|nr:hypothetical protein [Terracidiphilus sp.]